MTTEKFDLWNNIPGTSESVKPYITAYVPDNKKTDAAIVVLPGGGYTGRAPHEGEGYAKFLAENGVTAFVCDYRVAPDYFPCPLLDARRAVCFVRHNAAKYGLDANKIGIMGSSAGGHLAAMTSTYYAPVENEHPDEIDAEDFKPNFQILCYPVIELLSKANGAHIGSCYSLLHDKVLEMGETLNPRLNVSDNTPPCFIWHTFADGDVPVYNTLDYARRLKDFDIPTEVHIYPYGEHGKGLANTTDSAEDKHIAQWGASLLNWLEYMGF